MGVDNEGKLCFFPSNKDWLNKHEGRFKDYLNTVVDEYSKGYVEGIFNTNPFIGKTAIQDYIQNCEDITANLRRVCKFLMQDGHELIVVSGSRRSGKTSTTISLIEHIEKEYEINKVWVGQPNSELESHGWEIIPSLEELNRDDFGGFDEAGAFLGSRRGMSDYNVSFIDNLPTISHIGNAHLAVLTQSTKRSDVGILDYASMHVIKSYSDAFNLDVERGMITADLVYEVMIPRKDYVIQSDIRSWSFVRTGEFMSLVYLPMVEWYSDKVGKAFSKFETVEQGIQFAITAFVTADFDVKHIQKLMKQRGIRRPIEFWEELKESSINAEISKQDAKKFKEVQPIIEEGSENSEYNDKMQRIKERQEGKK